MTFRFALQLLLSLLALQACGGSSENSRGEHRAAPRDRTGKADEESVRAPRADDQIDFAELSTGLYWFGRDGRMQKALSALPSDYYSPDKPTLIYVHGWQLGSVSMGAHETPMRIVVDTQQDLAKPWIDKGWNVGFFLWTQFADDQLLMAEQKIWDNEAMSWIDSSGLRRPAPDQGSASELFFQAYREAMAEHGQTEIRIVGHSLGSQMASLLTKRLYDEHKAGRLDNRLLPERLVLLDPFFSGRTQSYLMNQKNGDVLRGYLAELITSKALALEIYRSSSVSLLPGADAHPELLSLAAFRNVYTDLIYSLDQQAEKHVYAVAYYLWSFAYPPSTLSAGTSAAPPGIPGTCLSAASTKTELLSYMASTVQVRSSDSNTATPADDVCYLEAKGTL